MIDEIEGIESISKKKKAQLLPGFEQFMAPVPLYTGDLLPHHFHQLVLKSGGQIAETASENSHLNRVQIRKWRLEDEKRDVWRRLEVPRNYNSLLNRMVAIIR